MRRRAIARSARSLAGVLAVAALTVAVSLANRMPHHSVAQLCCRYTPARLADGAWWTVLGSALLVSRQKLLGTNTVLLLGVVAPYACRQGNRRTLAVYFAGHVVATLAVAASLARRRVGVALFAGLAGFFAVHLAVAHTLSDVEHLLALTTGAVVGASSPIHGLRRRLRLIAHRQE